MTKATQNTDFSQTELFLQQNISKHCHFFYLSIYLSVCIQYLLQIGINQHEVFYKPKI